MRVYLKQPEDQPLEWGDGGMQQWDDTQQQLLTVEGGCAGEQAAELIPRRMAHVVSDGCNAQTEHAHSLCQRLHDQHAHSSPHTVCVKHRPPLLSTQ